MSGFGLGNGFARGSGVEGKGRLTMGPASGSTLMGSVEMRDWRRDWTDLCVAACREEDVIFEEEEPDREVDTSVTESVP